MTAVVAFELTSTATQAAAPFMIGHAFKQGDVPAGQYLHCDLANFAIVPTRYWNDGSVKLATVMGRVPLTAGTAKRVNLWRNGTPESAGTLLTAADIASAAPAASVQFGSFGTVSLASLLASPVLTFYSTKEMVCCVYSAKCPGDASLHAEFVVHLYAGGAMEVEVAAYNGYLNGTEAVQKDYVPTVIIGGATIWNNGGATYHHSRAASWVRRGWIGITDPQIIPTHDKGYLVRTRLFANYNVPSPNSVITAHAPYQTYNPGDNLLYSVVMGGVGYQPGIGILPNWEAAYLTTPPSATMYNVVMAHADAIRSYGIAWYDTNTARPIKIADFPRWSMAGLNQGGTPGANTIKQDNATTLTYEKAHNPSVGFMPYILSGKYLHMQTCMFNAITKYLTNSYLEGEGLLRVPAGQPRARGWTYRDYGDAGAIVPTHVTNQFSEIRTLVANVMASRVATYVTQTYAAKWTGLEDLLDNARIPSGYSYNGQMAAGASPFEQSFIISAMCHAADSEPCDAAGMANLRLFRDHVMQFVVGISGGGTVNDFNSGYSSNNAVHVRTSSLFTYASSSQVPVTAMNPANWGQIFSDSHGYKADGTTIVALGSDNGSGLAVTYNPPNPSTTILAPSSQPDSWPSATGSAANLRAALALAVDHNATGAATSWARILSAPNYATTQGAADYAGNPVFAISPRTSGEPALLFTPVDSGAALSIATIPMGAVSMLARGQVMSANRTFGRLASDIPSGFSQPHPLANDVDGADPVGTRYAYEVTTPPAGLTSFLQNQDGSIVATGPDGLHVGAQTTKKNGAWTTGEALNVQIGAVAPSYTITGVTVTPATLSAAGGATGTLSAVVNGANSPPQTVAWTITAGSINSASGAYTLPATTSSAQTVTATATASDGTHTGTCVFTIAAAVTPPPGPAAATVVRLTLETPTGALVVNESPIHFAFFAQSSVATLLAPVFKGATESTDGNAVIEFSIAGLTSMVVGDIGWLALSNPAGTTTLLCPVAVL